MDHCVLVSLLYPSVRLVLYALWMRAAWKAWASLEASSTILDETLGEEVFGKDFDFVLHSLVH